MEEENRKILLEIKAKIDAFEAETRKNRELQEGNLGLVPKFIENSPTIRSYRDYIVNLFQRHPVAGYMFQPGEVIHIMGHFDQTLLNDLMSVAKKIKIKIVSPADTINRHKNKDALERINKAGAEVRLHPMLHARIFCIPQRRFLIIGSGDIQADCFGGTRFDAGVFSDNLKLIEETMQFFGKVWDEAKPLKPT